MTAHVASDVGGLRRRGRRRRPLGGALFLHPGLHRGRLPRSGASVTAASPEAATRAASPGVAA